MRTHVFHRSYFTADNMTYLPPNALSSWQRIANQEAAVTCRVCGCSKHHPLHYTPKSDNPFPLFAGQR